MACLTCRQLIEFVDDYLAGELDAGVRERFEEHLRLCSNCRAYLSDYRASIRLAGLLRSATTDASAASLAPRRLIEAVSAALSPQGQG